MFGHQITPSNAGEDNVDLKAPLVFEVAIGSEVFCNVTPRLNTAFGVPWTPAHPLNLAVCSRWMLNLFRRQLVAKVLIYVPSDDADLSSRYNGHLFSCLHG